MHNTWMRPLAWVAVLAALALPIALDLNIYYLHVLNLAWIFAIAALGLQVATGITGQIVADLVAQRAPPLDLTPYRAARF